MHPRLQVIVGVAGGFVTLARQPRDVPPVFWSAIERPGVQLIATVICTICKVVLPLTPGLTFDDAVTVTTLLGGTEAGAL
jgi:hypothetical protein